MLYCDVLKYRTKLEIKYFDKVNKENNANDKLYKYRESRK